MSFNNFARRVRATAQNIPDNAHKAVQKVALAVDRTVVLATPVDTGRARANWQVGAGVAPMAVIEPTAPGEGGSTSRQNTQAALDQGKIAINAARPGQEIHITNNLAYIGRLNEGHSAQAPAGFVEEAVRAGISAVRSVKILGES